MEKLRMIMAALRQTALTVELSPAEQLEARVARLEQRLLVIEEGQHGPYAASGRSKA